MIKFRQKQYTSPKIRIAAKSQRAILNAADKFFKSKAGKGYLGAVSKVTGNKRYKDAAKGVEAISKTVKMVPQNPGKAIRRAAAGTVINPGMTAATVADPALGIAVPAYNASPVNLKMVAATMPGMTKSPELVQRIGRNMMRNNRRTGASRFGQEFEYHVNKGALGSSSILQGIAI